MALLRSIEEAAGPLSLRNDEGHVVGNLSFFAHCKIVFSGGKKGIADQFPIGRSQGTDRKNGRVTQTSPL
jgi:hypothetical protein